MQLRGYMKKIKLNVFFSRLLSLLLFIVVIAVAFLFIGCKECEQKETWDTIQDINNVK